MLRLTLITTFLGLCMSVITAQNVSVSGTVISAQTGEELIGASVIEKGTQNGVVTDALGHYSISVRTGSELTVSYVGYRTIDVKVPKGGHLDIRLDEEINTLDEVVVVGYGAMKRSDLTGAVSSIGEEAIRQGVNTSIEQAMQGRIAGVQVTQNSGTPGGGISVQIRGINSLNGNEPLYVIDGVEISGQTSDDSSVLSTLNPSDIVSIEVLKDASATAIYGSRASNGVVLVTTRQGQEGKPRISYDGYVGWQQLPTKVEMMNLKEYAAFSNERAEIRGYGKREDFMDPTLLTNGTDWQDEIFRTAFMQNHQVGITGGFNGTKYALSGGFLDQDGIGLGSNFRRASFRANFDTQIRSWLTVGARASYSNKKQTTTLSDRNLLNTALDQRPDIPVLNPDGSYGFLIEDEFNTAYSNPVYEALMRENYNKSSQLYYNLFASIKPIKGLTLRIEYGGSNRRGNVYYFQPEYTYGTVAVQSESTRTSINNDTWTLKEYATYDFSITRKHKFSIMAGHEAQHGNYEDLSGSRTGFISGSIHNLDVGDASSATNSNGSSSWAIESYYGRLNYNFSDRYLLTATIRTDGSSRLGPNNRWGTFPSVALAWRISNERFMKRFYNIDNLKLRLGWGIVGNQNAGNYAYGTTMKNTTTAWGTGYYPGNYSNPNLKWERTKSYNAGIDLALFDYRIEFIADVYYKKTDNLLMTASLPAYIIDSEGIGMSAPWVNVGGINNKGIELTLNTVNVVTKDWNWRTGITFTLNRNKVTKLNSESSEIFGKIGTDIFTRTAVGEPVGQYFGYNVIGMFTCEDDFYRKDASGNFLLDDAGERIPVARPADTNGVITPIGEDGIWVGDYIYEDVDGNGIIDEKDRRYIGNPNPKFTFGINNIIQYKDFTLSFFFNGSIGNDVYNFLRKKHADPSSWNGKIKEVGDFARIGLIDPNGSASDISNVYVINASSTEIQRINRHKSTDPNTNTRYSSLYVEDGSFLRLKTLSLTYNVPRNLLRKAGINSLQVYGNVENLFTITNYKGFDPEVGAYQQNVFLQGVDRGRYPSPRIYTFGLKLNL